MHCALEVIVGDLNIVVEVVTKVEDKNGNIASVGVMREDIIMANVEAMINENNNYLSKKMKKGKMNKCK